MYLSQALYSYASLPFSLQAYVSHLGAGLFCDLTKRMGLHMIEEKYLLGFCISHVFNFRETQTSQDRDKGCGRMHPKCQDLVHQEFFKRFLR